MPMNLSIGLMLGSVTTGGSAVPSNALTSKAGVPLTNKAQTAYLTSKA